MKHTAENLERVVALSVSALPEESGCEECFPLLAGYAEAVLRGWGAAEAHRRVEEHLERCSCCQEEFEVLKLALASDLR